jgi:hypothetical protein
VLVASAVFGAGSASASPAADHHFSWGAEYACDGPVEMVGSATLHYEGAVFDETGTFNGTGAIAAWKDATNTSGTYQTDFDISLYAPPGQVWTPTPGCVGEGTEHLSCLWTATQTLSPPS